MAQDSTNYNPAPMKISIAISIACFALAGAIQYGRTHAPASPPPRQVNPCPPENRDCGPRELPVVPDMPDMPDMPAEPLPTTPRGVFFPR